jgi:Arc/MetJ-type ribon-helix-helix transcriptional regulator
MMYDFFMRRTQIQLDEEMHEILRRKAYEQGTSLASVIRDALNRSLDRRPRRPARRKLRDFEFVGAGKSEQGALAPVSERHDEALAKALQKKTRP